MPKLTPEQRRQRATIAALARWAKEDPTAIAALAARGQAGLLAKFRREVLEDDPDCTEPELSRRVRVRQRLHMQRMAFARSKKTSPGGEAA